MDLNNISAGTNPPQDINVIIEVSQGSNPVKYECDKKSGALLVDRFMPTAMFYPANYGFVPATLAGDDDPIDVLVISEFPIQPGAVVRARPIGVLEMEDEGGEDVKILAVPHQKLTKVYNDVQNHGDLPEIVLARIMHFFENYKALESGKWVKLRDWKGAAEAEAMITEAVRNYKG
ncbi:MAG: inorganic diphosphatase [Alphaproteobacteria bacterium]|nr:inorganic diphosphatase [Alphaproteobacteria bacterium]